MPNNLVLDRRLALGLVVLVRVLQVGERTEVDENTPIKKLDALLKSQWCDEGIFCYEFAGNPPSEEIAILLRSLDLVNSEDDLKLPLRKFLEDIAKEVHELANR